MVLEIGGIESRPPTFSIKDLRKEVEGSSLRLYDLKKQKENEMLKLIDQSKEEGDSLGGAFLVIAEGVPWGLGSHVQWDRRLDGKLAQALVSIQAIKAVEIGDGVANARRKGSEAHDETNGNSREPSASYQGRTPEIYRHTE